MCIVLKSNLLVCYSTHVWLIESLVIKSIFNLYPLKSRFWTLQIILTKKRWAYYWGVYFCNDNQKEKDYLIIIIVVFSRVQSKFSQIVIRLVKFSRSFTYSTLGVQRYRILVRYGMRYGIGNKCAVRYSILGSAVYRYAVSLRYCGIELYYEIYLPDLQLVLFGQYWT